MSNNKFIQALKRFIDSAFGIYYKDRNDKRGHIVRCTKIVKVTINSVRRISILTADNHCRKRKGAGKGGIGRNREEG